MAIKKFEDFIKDSENAPEMIENIRPINEMARIRPAKSGLSMIVWLTPDDGTNTGQHNMPRLKFQDNTNTRLMADELVPMSIHPSQPMILLKNYNPKLPAKSIEQLKEWIVRNYQTLMRYWQNEIFEDELMELLK